MYMVREVFQAERGKAPEVVAGFAGVDADDLRHVRVVDQALHEQGAPRAGDAGDQNASLPGGHLRNSV